MRLDVAISCRSDEVSCGQYLNSQITPRSGYEVEAMFLVDSEAPQDYGSVAERQQRCAVLPCEEITLRCRVGESAAHLSKWISRLLDSCCKS
jgi:hypothetical protein